MHCCRKYEWIWSCLSAWHNTGEGCSLLVLNYPTQTQNFGVDFIRPRLSVCTELLFSQDESPHLQVHARVQGTRMGVSAQVKRLKYLWVLFISDGKITHEKKVLCRIIVVKKESGCKTKLLIYRLIQASPRVTTLSRDWKNDIVDTRSWNEFPL